MLGRRVALSLPRRLLTNLSHLARGFPRVTLVTRINVAALMEPRDQAQIPRPVVFANGAKPPRVRLRRMRQKAGHGFAVAHMRGNVARRETWRPDHSAGRRRATTAAVAQVGCQRG